MEWFLFDFIVECACDDSKLCDCLAFTATCEMTITLNFECTGESCHQSINIDIWIGIEQIAFEEKLYLLSHNMTYRIFYLNLSPCRIWRGMRANVRHRWCHRSQALEYHADTCYHGVAILAVSHCVVMLVFAFATSIVPVPMQHDLRQRKKNNISKFWIN